MKSLIIMLAMFFLFAQALNAQTRRRDTTKKPTAVVAPVTPAKKPPVRQRTNYIDKSNNALNGANKAAAGASGTVDNASATGTTAVNTAANASAKAKDFGSQVQNLLGKKPAAAGTTNTTQINVKGAKFAVLKKLNECIMGCSGVQDSKMKFNATESIITVTHTGTTEQLLKSIQKKSDLITDDKIDNFDEGKIDLTLK